MAGIYKDGVYYQPAPYHTCGICGSRFQTGGRWHNAFYCSVRCCDARRAQLAPPTLDEDYY